MEKKEPEPEVAMATKVEDEVVDLLPTEEKDVDMIRTERYADAIRAWPGRGQIILCQRRKIGDEEAILVYQAYCPEIAMHALKNQSFEHAPGYKTGRMTWIKPNFLWMMYRSGWASKHNQEMILGVWLKLSFFFEMLRASKSTQRRLKADAGVGESHRPCRIQWDPDHNPDGSAHPYRRALQLGIKGDYAIRYASSNPSISPVLAIVDMTPLAREGYSLLKLIKANKKKAHLLNELNVAYERVLSSSATKGDDAIVPTDLAEQIALDEYM